MSESARPQPKVPSTAWKWPPIWPFPNDFVEEVSVDAVQESAFPTESFTKHLSSFLSEGQSVLEITKQDQISLLPRDSNLIQLEPIVVGESQLKCDYDMPYRSMSVDAVVVSFGIEYITEPRNFFKEVWRVLKPGGKAFICFSKLQNAESLKPLKMWTTMTDEQKIWIAGSYYHYSAGEGWTELEGYDLLQTTGAKQEVFENSTETSTSAFVVQATKNRTSIVDSAVDSAYFTRRLRGIKWLENDDIQWLALRLASDYEKMSPVLKEDMLKYDEVLLQIYSHLKDVKELIIPSPIKALLAVLLVSKWKNTDAQKSALRRGLGLETGDDFWPALAKSTSALQPREKIHLLGDLIPCFGEISNTVLEKVPGILTEVQATLQAAFPAETEPTLQAVAVDLVVSDYLNVGPKEEDSSKMAARLIAFCRTLSADQFRRLAADSIMTTA